MTGVRNAIRHQGDLSLVVVMSILLIVVVALFPSNTARIILGLPVLLLAPGYSLLSLLFPDTRELSLSERIPLSLGLSVFILAVLGLFLTTTFSVQMNPLLVVGFTLVGICSTGAWYRRSKAHLTLSNGRVFEELIASLKTGRLTFCAVLLTIAVLLSVVGLIAYTVAVPRNSESFTEFYVLDGDGTSAEYPHTFQAGERTSILAGVVNHEAAPKAYRLAVTLDGLPLGEVDIPCLKSGEQWEGEVAFVPVEPSTDSKLRFTLHQAGSSDPCAELHLWAEVGE